MKTPPAGKTTRGRRVVNARTRLAHRLALRLEEQLGANVEAVVLHDWVAGEEASDEVDVQVVVITRSRDQDLADRVFRAATEVEIENEYRAVLSPLIYDSEQFGQLIARRFPHEREMLSEGQVIYDSGFFGELRHRELAGSG